MAQPENGSRPRMRFKLPPYVVRMTDRHGHAYYYYRRKGFPRARLPDLPWSSEFMEAYYAAAGETALPPLPIPSTLIGGIVKKRGVDPDTVQPLIGVYLLLLKGKVIYVGQSLNMPERVAGHQANGRPFDQVFYIATKANQREMLERILIRAIDPLQNKVHRSPVRPSDNQREAAE